jgi:hypothetical protein
MILGIGKETPAGQAPHAGEILVQQLVELRLLRCEHLYILCQRFDSFAYFLSLLTDKKSD